VRARELQERFQRHALGIQRAALCRLAAQRLFGGFAHLAAEIADQRAEDLVLGMEVRVKTAQRGPGAASDPGDRGFVEAPLAELDGCGIQQFS
tara:strand:+ start:6753 stop:7031 length:279 start_codon:yes stop_codon:yes gene_type:complete